MQIFFIVIIVMFITIYSGLFCHALYKTNNKKGAAAVLCLILIVIISPVLVYRY